MGLASLERVVRTPSVEDSAAFGSLSEMTQVYH